MAANELSERQRMLITLAVGVLLNAGLGVWLYSVYSNYDVLDKGYTAKENERKTLKEKVEKEGPLLKAELEQKTTELKDKQSKLPNSEEVEKLIDAMTDKARAAGASRINIMTEPGQASGPGANYERTVFHTRWNADLWSWCKLINNMEEQSKRFISFEKMTITPKNSGAVISGTQHEISVDLVAYRYLPKP